MKPHIIGIAGASGSGKTELSRQRAVRLPGTSIVSLDSYYRGMEEIALEDRKNVNFVRRDVAERGRMPECVVAQYEATVRPSTEWVVYPTEKYADLVVSGEERFDQSTDALLAALHRDRAVAGGL